MFKSILEKTLFFIFIFIALFLVKPVFAAEYYEYSCGQDFEVSYIKDDGTFEKVSCKSTFEEAYEEFNTYGDDYVLRHYESKSPTKIIAIHSGIAYSYPTRRVLSGEAQQTMNFSANEDCSGKITYVNAYRELDRPKTTSYEGDGIGRVRVSVNGFTGYAWLYQLDLIPQKFIDKQISIYIGGNDKSSKNEQPYSLIPNRDYYTTETSNNYHNLIFYSYNGAKGSKSKLVIGVAPSFMQDGERYYSYNGYEFYKDPEYKNFAGTYYNYYQYLPLRSKTNIDASTFDKFLASKGYTKYATSSYSFLRYYESKMVNQAESFIANQNKYGLNALLIYSLACLESGYGRSYYAVERNNLFGWNAIDADPGQATYFPSISQAIKEQMGMNLRGFSDITDWRFFGSQIGNKGSGFNVQYASDPYWGQKIAAIAYEIDKLDNNYNGELTDYNNYEIALVNTYDAKVYNQDLNKVFYSTSYGDGYQENFMVIVLEYGSEWTLVQLTNPVKEDGNLFTHRTDGKLNDFMDYDFSRSIGYMKTSDLIFFKSHAAEPEPPKPENKFIFNINDIKPEGDKLNLNILAYRSDFTADNIADIKYKLIASSAENSNEYDFDASLLNNQYIGLNDSIDLSGLKDGTYSFILNVYFKDQIVNTVVLNYSLNSEYSFRNHKYKYYYENNTLKLDTSILELEHKYTSSMSNVELKENGILYIKGMGLIKNIDNNENIKHELVFKDINNDNAIVSYTVDNSLGDYNMNEVYKDGFDYSYAWYEGEVNLSELSRGEYIVYLKTTVGDIIKEKKLYGSSKMVNTSSYDGEDYLSTNILYSFLYRLEIDCRGYDFEKSPSPNKLPRIVESYNNLISVELIEDNLVFNGTGLIYGANMGDNNGVEYTLYAINEYTGEVFESTAIGSNLYGEDEAPWNNTDRLHDGKNYDYTWYQLKLNLNELTQGDYRFMLRIKTDEYIDYVEVKKINNSNVYSGERAILNTNNAKHLLRMQICESCVNVTDVNSID